MSKNEEPSVGRVQVDPNIERDVRLKEQYGEELFNKFSPETKSKLNDIDLKRRYEIQERDIDKIPNLSDLDKQVSKVNFSMSSIEGLGGRLIMTFAPEEDLNKLVDALHKQEKFSRDALYTDQKDKDHSKLNVAKTEAALKGFAFPTSPGGPADSLTEYGLSEQEKSVAFESMKQALVNVSDKKIPREEYATKVQEEFIKIIGEENSSFDKNKIASFKKFVEQGVKSPQDKGMTVEEKKTLTQAAQKTSNELIKIFDKNIELNEKFAANKELTNKLIDKFTSKGTKISPETEAKFQEIVTKITDKLGVGFVKKNMNGIADAMAKEIDKNKTFLSNFRSDLSISSNVVQKVTENISKSFEKEATIERQKDAQQALQKMMKSEGGIYGPSNRIILEQLKDIKSHITSQNKEKLENKTKDEKTEVRVSKKSPKTQGMSI